MSEVADAGATVVADLRKKLENARNLGHKLQGRAYSADWCERMAAVDSEEYHNDIDHDVEVINMMSGNPVTIKASERGGPCDPSTERYWSM